MELTAQYLREHFWVLNNDYFDNELPEPQFAVTNARTQMGQFSCKRVRKGFFGKYANTSYKIKVSEYYEQTAEEIDDTLLHEMIHFLIAFRQLRDTSAHGQLFRKEMNRLNRMGRHITISARTTQYVTTPKNQRKQHLVLALEGRDCSRYLSVVHPSYRKYVERQLPLAPQIAAHYWFVSNDSIFDSFSQVRSLRARKITKEVYDKVVDKKQ